MWCLSLPRAIVRGSDEESRYSCHARLRRGVARVVIGCWRSGREGKELRWKLIWKFEV